MSLFWQTILQVSGVCLWIELSYFTLFLVLECFFGNPDDVLVRFYILLIAVPISVFKSKIYKQFRWCTFSAYDRSNLYCLRNIRFNDDHPMHVFVNTDL